MSRAAATVFIQDTDEPTAYVNGDNAIIRFGRAIDGNIAVLSELMSAEVKADYLDALVREVSAVAESLRIRAYAEQAIERAS